MGPGFGRIPPLGKDPYQKSRPKPPEGIRDLPRFLWETVRGFFIRLIYIFRMVWETGPWILFVMMFTAVFSGVMPIAFLKTKLK